MSDIIAEDSEAVSTILNQPSSYSSPHQLPSPSANLASPLTVEFESTEPCKLSPISSLLSPHKKRMKPDSLTANSVEFATGAILADDAMAEGESKMELDAFGSSSQPVVNPLSPESG